MANSIQRAEKYLPIVDKGYSIASKSAVLETPEWRVRWDGSHIVYVMDVALTGMQDYDRATGYGSDDTVTSTWKPYTLEIDRSETFMIDAMDDNESLSQLLSATLGEFTTKFVVPEDDAYTFAKLYGSAGTKVTTAYTDIADAIDTDIVTLADAGVSVEGCFLFISNAEYKKLKGSCVRTIMNGEDNIQREVMTYEGMRVITVPQDRFKTTVTLNDGSVSRGFTPGATSIKFMIVDPSAVIKVTKHNPSKLFTPSENQEADAYKFVFRKYGDVFVIDGKKMGVLAHS